MKKFQLLSSVAALVACVSSSVASVAASVAYELRGAVQRLQTDRNDAAAAPTSTTSAIGGADATTTAATATAVTTTSTTRVHPSTAPASLWSKVKCILPAGGNIARHSRFHANNRSADCRFPSDAEWAVPGGTLFAFT